jgi:putative hemolysin
VIAFAVITYLSLVFGELVPKALTLDRAETLAARVARPVELLSISCCTTSSSSPARRPATS